MNRRNFLKNTMKASSVAATFSMLPAVSFGNDLIGKTSIDRITLYRYDSNIPRYFSFGTWYNRQQVFMKISAGKYHGWAETSGQVNNPDLDLAVWGKFLEVLKGKDVYEAYDHIKANQKEGGLYSYAHLEFMEMALLDLIGRIENKPAVDILHMKGTEPVPGLFCILNKDLGEVEENIQKAIADNLDSHVKFKMYGKKELDLEIARLARKNLGENAFILSDINSGYKDFKSIDELAEIMIDLRKAGLNAVEDPAVLSNAQWIELQSKVGELSLVPDEPLRPSWEGIKRIEKGMGRYYNMHPDLMGSLATLKPLAEKIKRIGGGIMLGDNSLVGPACNMWQQIAIGVGASWVEAIEKEDSEAYLSCVVSKPTYRNDKGLFAMKKAPGFGLEINEEKLSKLVAQITIL